MRRGFGKTDVRYWRERVKLRGDYQTEEFSIEIQFRKERHRFHLKTPNREAAAAKAKNIYLSLLSNGWHKTLEEYAPESLPPEEEQKSERTPTVGDLISEVSKLSTARRATLETYFKALRKIASDVAGITGEDKFRSKTGGTAKWRQKVEAVELGRLTPEALQDWKVAFLRAAGNDPAAIRKARTTYNSLVRNARALFSKKLLPHLKERLNLPDPIPLSTLDMEKRQSMRYRSKIDPQEILAKAKKQLGGASGKDEKSASKREQFKILLLGLLCGLRKSEIDSLLWEAFDFDKGIIVIEPTEFNHLKSEDSAGEVDLDDELTELFRDYSEVASGPFVIESKNSARNLAERRCYRAEIHFKRLNTWLRANGVDATKPIHELRKEYGALVTQRAGIYAASRALRHSDIGITVAHYADKKEKVTSGLSIGDL